MKVTVNIDCTPEEARAFFGLPDVRPLQAELMKEVGDRMRQALAATDPETMMKTWLPASIQGFEQLQRFWGQVAAGMAGAAGGTGGPSEAPKGGKKP